MSQPHSSSAPKYETQEFNFKALLWAIPIGVILLIIYVAICWFGAKKSLNSEMTKKQFQSMEADSSQSGATPQ